MNFSTSTLSNFLSALDFVGIVACLLVILILLFRRGYWVKGSGLMLCAFLIMLYVLVVLYLFDSGTIYNYPHFDHTVEPVGYLYMPTVYLYMLTKERPLRWTDGLHLLPTLLFVIDFLPFYTLSADTKAIILGGNYPQQFTPFVEGWLFPRYWLFHIQNIQLIIYWLLVIRILRNLLKRHRNDFLTKNWAWFNWILAAIMLQPFALVPAVGGILFDWNNTIKNFWYVLGLTLMALLTCFTLILRPEILYGLQDSAEPTPDTPVPADQTDHKEELTEPLEHYIPQSLISAYDRQIQDFMQVKEAFLKPGYTIREMAENTGIPLHYLSAVINRHYGYHFNEYINHWRIDYLKQRLDKNEWKHKTLEALAQESGFTNRTSFISAFKKQCGTTPSDYIRNRKDIA
jgi:AraC-like DNA-binding protein